ncbi:MAG: carbohydrate ABC transporter permease [Lachnospirales bacterium]
MKTKSLGSTLYKIFLYAFMIFIILVCTVPFLYIIAMSISSPEAIINGEVFLIPKGINFEAYKTIFSYPKFFSAYLNTIFYTVAGTLISLAMTVLFAYPLAKVFLRGRNAIMRLVIFSMFFSGGLIPNYLLISSLGLTKSVWAMLVPFAISQFNLIILMNFFRGLPKELEEAALIDGLDYFGILIKIIIPLSTPAIATIALYTAVFFWNDWFHGLIYLSTDQFPVMLFLRNIVNGASAVGEMSGEKTTIAMSIKSAVIITTTLPIIILYPFLQKYFVKGLTVGSVKG